jgi:hypothetical protein
MFSIFYYIFFRCYGFTPLEHRALFPEQAWDILKWLSAWNLEKAITMLNCCLVRIATTNSSLMKILINNL